MISFVVRLTMVESDKELVDKVIELSKRKLSNFIAYACVKVAREEIE